MLYRLLMQACGLLAAALLGGMVLLVSFDVIARNLGLLSLPWIVEVTEYSLPLATFLAAPWLMYRNEHVRLDVLGNLLGAGNLRRLDRIASGVGAVVSAVAAWYGLAALLDSRAAGSVVIKSLVFPEWWLLVPLPVCFALLAVECVRRLRHPASHDVPAVAGLEEERG
ncbi:MAG: TRAP transporter small permease [Burkholderiales bacterium]|nr:TRAP transporter small permease [Burkholderiales bacterium]